MQAYLDDALLMFKMKQESKMKIQQLKVLARLPLTQNLLHADSNWLPILYTCIHVRPRRR